MKLEDALRKIQLLRRVRPESGAFEAEVKSAVNLERVLINRFSLPSHSVHAARPREARLTWIYWDMLFEEFGLQLRRFGKRGSALLSGDRIVYISLAGGEWRVQRLSSGGWEKLKQGQGIESFRAYLANSTHRPTFMFGRSRR